MTEEKKAPRGIAFQRARKGAAKGQLQAMVIRDTGTRRYITEKQKREFLEHLSELCNVSLAAELAGLDKRHIYVVRQRDAGFRAG